MRGFHGAFATGVASQQGTLTLPDTWFRPPFWDLLMLQLLRPNSSNWPCLYSTFHLEYPLVLSRFCSSFIHNYYPTSTLGDKLSTCSGTWVVVKSKIEKVPRGIRGEKSSKDMASSRNLVSTIGVKNHKLKNFGSNAKELVQEIHMCNIKPHLFW